MLLGIIIFTLGLVISNIKMIILHLKKYFAKILSGIFLVSSSLFFMYVLNYYSLIEFNIFDTISNSFLIERVSQKIDRIDGDSDVSIIEERGIDKILNEPHKILYGAGEGMYSRFKGKFENEIHSTFPSILFYYGIIPFFIFVAWIYQKLKNLPFHILCVYIALFIESFFLLNQRQALFFAIIVLGSFCSKKEDNKNNDSNWFYI